MLKTKTIPIAMLFATACVHGYSVGSSNQCALAAEERAWIKDALSAWDLVRTEKLHLSDAFRAKIIVFDERCRFEAPREGRLRWQGVAHQGQISLPDGRVIPPTVTSFTAEGGGSGPFFVMALPSIWRAANVQSELDFTTFLTVVFLHEYMHTRQAYFATPRLTALVRPPANIPEGVGDDDALQARFENDPEYRAAYERERDLLYAAAEEKNLSRARSLAAEALKAMRARQARWFQGPDAGWKDFDDIFLTMEGVGQWVGYAWLTDRRGGSFQAGTARRAIRRGKKWWSQEQGLAIFLVIDRLLPNWQALAFAHEPVMAIDLLDRAVRAPSRP